MTPTSAWRIDRSRREVCNVRWAYKPNALWGPRARILKSSGWVNPGAAPRGYTSVPLFAAGCHGVASKMGQPGAEWRGRLASGLRCFTWATTEPLGSCRSNTPGRGATLPSGRPHASLLTNGYHYAAAGPADTRVGRDPFRRRLGRRDAGDRLALYGGS